jgi:hypothetical protein
LAKAAKSQFYKNIEDRLPGSAINLYKLSRSLKGDHSDCPKIMQLNRKTASSIDEVVDLFREFFMSVFDDAPSCANFPRLRVEERIHIPFVYFSLSDVEQGFDELDVSKSAGPDKLPPLFLKNCSAILCGVLQRIFNDSVAAGTFPSIWKESYIIPIFKKGDRSDIKNYRPICIQSSIPKLFERILLNKIKNSLTGLISDQQHGFMRKRSTLTNLLEFHSDIMDTLVARGQLDCVYTDYSKAFDRVSHPILLAKLQSLGVDGALLSWFASYLTGRMLRVCLSNTVSSSFVALSGVPQGSHLGPILFNIFINDLLTVFDGVGVVMFADDLKIYRVIKSADDCSVLQRNVDALLDWCSGNALALNVAKCQVVRFYKIKSPIIYTYRMDGEELESVSQVRDLGVQLDTGLTFVPHINSMVDRALRTLGFVLRLCRSFTKVSTFVNLFTCLVRPQLEYNSVLWSPYYQVHITRIERVQNKLLRFINFKLGIPAADICYDHLHRECDLTLLSERRIIADMTFLHRLVNGQIDSPQLLSLVELHAPSNS